MLNTTVQGIPLPDSGDGDNVPYHMAQQTAAIESRLVMRFTSTTQRDTLVGTPVDGMQARVTGGGDAGLYEFRSGSWRRLDTWALGDAIRAFTASQTITGAASTWLPLTTPLTISVTLTHRTLVAITYSAWFQPTTGQSFRVTAAVTGNNTFGGTEAENLIVAVNTEQTGSMTRYLPFQPGTSTVELRAWKSTTANMILSTAQLQVVPLRWF